MIDTFPCLFCGYEGICPQNILLLPAVAPKIIANVLELAQI